MDNNTATTNALSIGDQVICNGYNGTIINVTVNDMLEVRVPGGVVCVGRSSVQAARFYTHANRSGRLAECTNVQACFAASNPDPLVWKEAGEWFTAANMTPLWIENGVRYFGKL